MFSVWKSRHLPCSVLVSIKALNTVPDTMVCVNKIHYFCSHDHDLRINVILNNIIIENVILREKPTELILQSERLSVVLPKISKAVSLMKHAFSKRNMGRHLPTAPQRVWRNALLEGGSVNEDTVWMHGSAASRSQQKSQRPWGQRELGKPRRQGAARLFSKHPQLLPLVLFSTLQPMISSNWTQGWRTLSTPSSCIPQTQT